MMDMIPNSGQEQVTLKSMTTERLRAELAKSLQLNAEQLLYLASIWRELEARGQDLSDLRTGMGTYLPLIAAGRLAPEAVVTFAGQITVLRSLVDLPIPEQRRIAAGGELEVVTLTADGTTKISHLPAYSMTASQARQVFDIARLRDTKEQEALLLQTVTRRAKSRPANYSKIRVDGDMMVIGRKKVPVAEILAALTSEYMTSGAEKEETTKTVPIQLTEAEHRALRIKAAESSTGMSALAKMAVCRLVLSP